MRGLRWILLLAALLLGAARAQAPVTLGGEGSYPLTHAFSWLEDEGGALPLDEILRPQRQAGFRPVPARGSNFGLSSSAFWLRADLRLAPGAPREWLLEVAYPPLDRIELYVPDGRGGYVRELAGDSLPGSGRIPHRNHVLRVSLPAGDAHTLYMRISSQGPVSAPTRLWQPAALWAADQETFAALSMYFGLLLGLLAYNLLLFFSVRDRAFVLYVAFASGMAVAQAALTGFGPRFLWGGWPWWVSVSPNVGNSFAAIFGLLFAREFLACDG